MAEKQSIKDLRTNLTVDESSDESEEQENQNQIPTVAKSKVDKDKHGSSDKSSESSAFKEWFDKKIEKTFFTNYNKFFGDNYYQKCTVLSDIKKDSRVENQLRLFMKGLEKFTKSKQKEDST